MNTNGPSIKIYYELEKEITKEIKAKYLPKLLPENEFRKTESEHETRRKRIQQFKLKTALPQTLTIVNSGRRFRK